MSENIDLYDDMYLNIETRVLRDLLEEIYYHLTNKELLKDIFKKDFVNTCYVSGSIMSLEDYRSCAFDILEKNNFKDIANDLMLLSLIINPENKYIEALRKYIKSCICDTLNSGNCTRDTLVNSLELDQSKYYLLISIITGNNVIKPSNAFMNKISYVKVYEEDTDYFLRELENLVILDNNATDFESKLKLKLKATDIKYEYDTGNLYLTIEINSIRHLIVLDSRHRFDWCLTVYSNKPELLNVDSLFDTIKECVYNRILKRDILNNWLDNEGNNLLEILYVRSNYIVKCGLSLANINSYEDFKQAMDNTTDKDLYKIMGCIMSRYYNKINSYLSELLLPILCASNDGTPLSPVKRQILYTMMDSDELKLEDYIKLVKKNLGAIVEFLVSNIGIYNSNYIKLLHRDLSVEQFNNLIKQYKDATFIDTVNNYLKGNPNIERYQMAGLDCINSDTLILSYNLILESGHTTYLRMKFVKDAGVFIFLHFNPTIANKDKLELFNFFTTNNMKGEVVEETHLFN